MIKAIIFDMDGVLIDSIPAHFDAWCAFFKQYGVPYTKDAFQQDTGPSTRELMAAYIQKHHIPLPLDAAMREKERLSEERLLNQDALFPNVKETLAALKPAYLLAVATSAGKEFASRLLIHTGIMPLFSTMVGGDEVPQSKPNPAIFLEAAKRLPVAPQDCVVVEDSPRGIDAAKAAKMQVIGITTSFTRERLHQADVIIARFAEIPGALKQLKVSQHE